MHAIKHIFSAECCCQSPGEDVTRKEFTAFLDMKKCKNCTHKISPWEYLTLWRPVLPVSREHGVPHFCSPPWAPLRGGWRSAGARRASFLLSTLNTSQGRSTVAHNLILVEADGVHQRQVPICHWQRPALNTFFKGTKVYHTLPQQVLWPLLLEGLKNNK